MWWADDCWRLRPPPNCLFTLYIRIRERRAKQESSWVEMKTVYQVKGGFVHKKSEIKEFIDYFPSLGHMLDQFQRRRSPASIIVVWEIKDLNPSVSVLHSFFPEFLLLNTVPYDVGYSFDHWGSAVLVMSLPIFLFTPSKLADAGKKERKPWHCKQHNRHNNHVLLMWFFSQIYLSHYHTGCYEEN